MTGGKNVFLNEQKRREGVDGEGRSRKRKGREGELQDEEAAAVRW